MEIFKELLDFILDVDEGQELHSNEGKQEDSELRMIYCMFRAIGHNSVILLVNNLLPVFLDEQNDSNLLSSDHEVISDILNQELTRSSSFYGQSNQNNEAHQDQSAKNEGKPEGTPHYPIIDVDISVVGQKVILISHVHCLS